MLGFLSVILYPGRQCLEPFGAIEVCAYWLVSEGTNLVDTFIHERVGSRLVNTVGFLGTAWQDGKSQLEAPWSLSLDTFIVLIWNSLYDFVNSDIWCDLSRKPGTPEFSVDAAQRRHLKDGAGSPACPLARMR